MSYICCEHLEDHFFVMTISQGILRIHLFQEECNYVKKFKHIAIYENSNRELVLSCYKCNRYHTLHFFPLLCTCSMDDFYHSDNDNRYCDSCSVKFIDKPRYKNLFGYDLCICCVQDNCPNISIV